MYWNKKSWISIRYPAAKGKIVHVIFILFQRKEVDISGIVKYEI
jgi:hypothetical protein